jgi:predicted RNase H-like HicB family nuclease
MSYRFKVVFEREPDGGYSVHVPALQGCASQGDTFDEALANIQEAIKLYLWSLKDDGLPIPETDGEILVKDIEVVA